MCNDYPPSRLKLLLLGAAAKQLTCEAQIDSIKNGEDASYRQKVMAAAPFHNQLVLLVLPAPLSLIFPNPAKPCVWQV